MKNPFALIKGHSATCLIASVMLLTGATKAISVTLDDYVWQGLESDITLQQSRLTREKSHQAVREARGKFLPSLSLAVQANESDGNVLDLGKMMNPVYSTLNQMIGRPVYPTDVKATIPQARQVTLQMIQPIYQSALYENFALRSDLNQADEAAEEIKAREVVVNIKTAYFNYAKSSKVVEFFQNMRRLLEENLRVAKTLVESGRATSEAIFRARADLAEVQQRLSESIVLRTNAERYFNTMLDRPLDALIEMDTTLISSICQAADSSSSIEGSVAFASMHREEYDQINHYIAASKHGVGIARSSFIPSAALVLTRGYEGEKFDLNGNKGYSVLTVKMNWNLFNGFQDNARSEQARIDRRSLELQKQHIDQMLELQVHKSLDDVRVSREGIKTAEERLTAAKSSWEITKKKYGQGESSQIEYIDARTAFSNAEINEIVTKYDYLIQCANLERALGSYPINTNKEAR